MSDVQPTLAAPDERPVLRGWLHLVAAFVAAVSIAPLAVLLSPAGGIRLAAVVYAVGVVALFAVSGTYHRVFYATRFGPWAQRADHSMIFVFIAATYTPLAVAVLDTRSAAILLAIAWGGAGAGIALRMVWMRAPRVVVTAPYLAVGWAALPFVGRFVHGLGPVGFGLLAAGGVLYTVGALIYGTRRPDPSPRWFGYHEVFHALVIAAVICHYLSITLFAFPLAAV